MEDSSAVSSLGLVTTTGTYIEDTCSGPDITIEGWFRSAVPYSYVEKKASEASFNTSGKDSSFNFPAVISLSEEANEEMQAFLGDFSSKDALLSELDVWGRFLNTMRE